MRLLVHLPMGMGTVMPLRLVRVRALAQYQDPILRPRSQSQRGHCRLSKRRTHRRHYLLAIRLLPPLPHPLPPFLLPPNLSNLVPMVPITLDHLRSYPKTTWRLCSRASCLSSRHYQLNDQMLLPVHRSAHLLMSSQRSSLTHRSRVAHRIDPHHLAVLHRLSDPLPDLFRWSSSVSQACLLRSPLATPLGRIWLVHHPHLALRQLRDPAE